MIGRTVIGDEQVITEEAYVTDSFHNGITVIDLGGARAPLARADCIVDLREPDWGNKRGNSPERHPRIEVCDLCEGVPFQDGAFDYSFCSQVLEDVRDPVGLVREISRVSNLGYISTVHWTYEANHRALNGLVGYDHHRWLINVKDGVVECVYKPPYLSLGLDHPEDIQGHLYHIWWAHQIEAREVFYEGESNRKSFLQFLQDRWQ